MARRIGLVGFGSLVVPWLFWSFWTILSIDLRPGLFCVIKSLGDLDVFTVIGLCCGESQKRWMTSTVSDLFQETRPVLTNEEFRHFGILACFYLD